MENTNLLIAVIFVILIVAFIWSPWITEDYAEGLVSQKFKAKWEGVADGCGFNCEGCGVKESYKALFGYNVKIEYACGLLPADSPEYHKIDTIFVSSLGTVHGLN